MDVEIAYTTDAFDRPEWDRLGNNSVLCSYGWLRCTEETWIPAPTPVYFLLREKGRLVGASVCYESAACEQQFTADDILLGPAKAAAVRLGMSLLPALVCSPCWSYGKHVLAAPDIDPDRRARIRKNILDAMERYASRKNYSLILRNMLDDEGELLALLAQRGYLRTIQTVINYIDIRWSSFDDYLKHLRAISKNITKNIKWQMNKMRTEGIFIERISDIDANRDRLHALADMHYRKWNSKSVFLSPQTFSELQRQLNEDASVYGAWKSGELVGFCLMLKRGGASYCNMVGIDHERVGRDLTYFNLLYHYPIADAINANMTRIYYGTGMHRVKRRRGCDASKVYICCKPVNLLKKTLFRPVFQAHAYRARKKVPSWVVLHKPVTPL